MCGGIALIETIALVEASREWGIWLFEVMAQRGDRRMETFGYGCIVRALGFLDFLLAATEGVIRTGV